jgi:hypothetical protein
MNEERGATTELEREKNTEVGNARKDSIFINGERELNVWRGLV